MKKRGEITSGTLVWIIITVIGFGIVALIISQLSWTGKVDKEVCHQSVIYRATLPSFAQLKDYVPLKCKTDKTCITSGLIGGKCPQLENTPGVTTVKVKDADQVAKVITGKMYDCWTMMGEGKVSIFSQWWAQASGLGDVYPSCVICSRISFDMKNLDKQGLGNEQLKNVDVFGYMATHALPDKDISYADYFTKEGGQINVDANLLSDSAAVKMEPDADVSASDGSGSASTNTSNSADSSSEIDDGILTTKNIEKEGANLVYDSIERQIDFSKDDVAIVFMQITSPSHAETFSNLLSVTSTVLGFSLGRTTAKKTSKGGILVPTSMGSAVPKKALISGGAKAGARKVLSALSYIDKAIIALAVVTGAVQQANVYWQRSVTAGYCGDVSFGDSAREGCSAVRAVNYDEDTIRQYCSTLENIP